MTTLVTLASKHCLVMGADSLGTTTRRLVNPFELSEFFDSKNDLKLTTGDDDKPILTDLFQLIAKAKHIPYNQLLHVNKLFKLGKLPIGVAFSGVTSIGPNTTRGLITEFTEKDPAVKAGGSTNYTVQSIARRLQSFLWKYYEAEFKQEWLGKTLNC